MARTWSAMSAPRSHPVEGRIGDLVDSLLTTLLVIVGMLTALLAYLIVIHGGI